MRSRCRAFGMRASHKFALALSCSLPSRHNNFPTAPPPRWRHLPATLVRARARAPPPHCRQLTAKRHTDMAQEEKQTSAISSPPPAPPSPRASALLARWMRSSRSPSWKKMSTLLSRKSSDRALLSRVSPPTRAPNAPKGRKSCRRRLPHHHHQPHDALPPLLRLPSHGHSQSSSSPYRATYGATSGLFSSARSSSASSPTSVCRKA